MITGSSCRSLIVIKSKLSYLFQFGIKLTPHQITLVYLCGMLTEEDNVIQRGVKHFTWNKRLRFREDSGDMIHTALKNVIFL